MMPRPSAVMFNTNGPSPIPCPAPVFDLAPLPPPSLTHLVGPKPTSARELKLTSLSATLHTPLVARTSLDSQ